MKPAVTSSATGISAKSSRVRALNSFWSGFFFAPARRLLAVLRLRRAGGGAGGSEPSRSSMSSIDVARVVLGAQLVLGDDLLALRRERGGLDADRELLRVEVDPERKLVGEAAVERDAAVLVGAEEVDLAGEQDEARRARPRPRRRSRRS